METIITLELIKEDIHLGKVRGIFVSTQSLWWTHLRSDLLEATEEGKVYRERAKIGHSPKSILTDPLGYPVTHWKAKDWIARATAPDREILYGANGFATFLFTHHQNNKKFFYNKWEDYDNKLTELLKK
jgi:hypothetical protein